MIWLLCDYGEVISLPQPLADKVALEEEVGRFGPSSGAPTGSTVRAMTAVTPRSRSTGTPCSDSGRSAEGWSALIELDIAGWLHPNPASLTAATRAAERGLRLAVLSSNAPHEVADAIDNGRLGWSVLTSALQLPDCEHTKPEQEVYVAALQALDAAPSQVTFFDDRRDNVCAARRAGMSPTCSVTRARSTPSPRIQQQGRCQPRRLFLPDHRRHKTQYCCVDESLRSQQVESPPPGRPRVSRPHGNRPGNCTRRAAALRRGAGRDPPS